MPAHLRLILWLGLERHQESWTNREQVEGDFCVYAETVSDALWRPLVHSDTHTTPGPLNLAIFLSNVTRNAGNLTN